jgi:hypothetical protein
MAGTAVSWKTTNIALNPGQLWANLAIPGAGARLTLDADGTPDATANPSALHLGATKAGAKFMVKSTVTNVQVDEFRAPISSFVDAVQMGISAELVGVTHSELLAFLLPGVGTYSTASGYKQVTIGSKAIVYSSIACIFPLIEDVTKYGVFHIYSGLNDAGVEWAQARTELGGTPVSFVGYEITSRAVADTLGNVWKQIA